MSLAGAVAGLASKGTALLADGSASFHPTSGGPVQLTASGEAPILELSAGASPGAVEVVIGDAQGRRLRGTVSAGSSVIIDGETVTTSEKARAELGLLTVAVAPPLVGTYAAGESVELAEVATLVPSVVTVSENASQVDWAAEGIRFAFQYSRSAVEVVPQVGWGVTRVRLDGTSGTGTVKRVTDSGVQVLVYVGG